MTTLTVAASFTKNGGQPATGLALSDIALNLIARRNSDGALTIIWDGTPHPDQEIPDVGTYALDYDDADLTNYSYFALAQYTGADTLDSNYVSGSLAQSPGPSGEFAVTISVVDAVTDLPLPLCLVTVKDSADTVVIDQKATSALGQAVFQLDAASYRIYVGGLPWYSSLGAQPLVVAGETAQEYALIPTIPSTPVTPSVCRLYGYEYLDASPVAARTITVNLLPLPQTTDSVILEGPSRTANSDASGYWYLDLVQGKTYEVSIPEAGILRRFEMPAAPSVDLRTLL